MRSPTWSNSRAEPRKRCGVPRRMKRSAGFHGFLTRLMQTVDDAKYQNEDKFHPTHGRQVVAQPAVHSSGFAPDITLGVIDRVGP